MSKLSVAKVIQDFNRKIIDKVKEGADLARDPRTTGADIERWERGVRAVIRDGVKDITDEAWSEAREAATKHLLGLGVGKAEAEALASDSVKRVVALSLEVRDVVPKVKDTGRLVFLKVAAAVASLAAGSWIFANAMPHHQSETEKTLAAVQSEVAETERIRELSTLLISGDDFNVMIGGLEVPSAPVPNHADDRAAAAAEPRVVQEARAAPELPAAVAAEAAQPVAVEVVTPTATRNFTTTIAAVYQNAPPQVQRQIEQEAPKIDHGYDHENVNDCAHTHCLSHHKTFTVDGTPFGSATFSY
ncbi:MAG TPA: hypothetical protein VHS78_18990 [Candidatus Elarobacter sp.]|jgi:hypothetical protein|nr:hypothetical protein [Candidatus Elarobacter sp.]